MKPITLLFDKKFTDYLKTANTFELYLIDNLLKDHFSGDDTAYDTMLSFYRVFVR